MNFIRNNNNVTWRNFNVVNRDPDNPEALFALPWLMPGAPEERLRFALDMNLRLPPEAEVLLELPLQFLRNFEAQLDIVEINEGAARATARLPASARLRFGPALMGAKERHEMRFQVRLNSKDPDAVYRIDLRADPRRQGRGRPPRLALRPACRRAAETPSRASLSPRIAAALRPPRTLPAPRPRSPRSPRPHSRPPSRRASAARAPGSARRSAGSPACRGGTG